MRTKKAIGWNIAPGGHRGPGWTKGNKKSKESISDQIITRNIMFKTTSFSKSLKIIKCE
jgi:hypothetical protein